MTNLLPLPFLFKTTKPMHRYKCLYISTGWLIYDKPHMRDKIVNTVRERKRLGEGCFTLHQVMLYNFRNLFLYTLTTLVIYVQPYLRIGYSYRYSLNFFNQNNIFQSVSIVVKVLFALPQIFKGFRFGLEWNP